MATVINNPTTDSGNSVSTLVGIILLLVVAFLFLYYLLPFLSSANRAASPTVNVPDKVDVNIQNPPQK